MKKSIIRKAKGSSLAILLMAVVMLSVVLWRNYNSIENQIIRAIDKQCPGAGECTISLAEATNFAWDAVSIVAGHWPSAKETLGIDDVMYSFMTTDASQGIVFQLDGKVVKAATSAIDHELWIGEPLPRLIYWREEGGRYSYNDALLRAEKVRRSNGLYRYILYG